MISIILLAIVRNRENRENTQDQMAKWLRIGLGTLIFPVIFVVIDGLETIVTGICLDTTYGYAMPEGDGIIIVGMEYAIFALGCWIYLYWKEGKVYNPFTRRSAPRLLGALTDNVGMVFYSYAMAMNSVSTDFGFDRSDSCCLSVLAMIGDRLIMKEKVSAVQYVFLLGIVAGSIMVIADTVF